MIIVKIYDFFVIKGLILCNGFIYFDTIRVSGFDKVKYVINIQVFCLLNNKIILFVV